MKCKFCLAEMEDGVTVCPLCGKELTAEEEVKETEENKEAEAVEETEEVEEAEEIEEVEDEDDEYEEIVKVIRKKKKKKVKGRGLKITLAVTALVLLAAILTGAVLHFAGVINVTKWFGEKDIYYKDSYTVSDKKAEKKADTVIAVLGDQELTNGELQFHYWSGINDFCEYYGSYISYFLDLSKPFDEQIYDEETGMTYQQYFLENALESWTRFALLAQMADDAGFTFTDAQQAELDALPSYLQEMATQAGYQTAEEYVAGEFYPGCTLDGYISYNTVSWKAICYYDVLYDELMPTQEEVDAYYAANEETFKTNGTSKEDGLYYDVRHILIPIEGEAGEIDGEVAYTDEQWEQCLAKAQKVIDDFVADNGDEAMFAQLAKELSADPGSADNGGMYTNLTKDTQFIENFKNWYLDESRQIGDIGLVKNTESSTQGYHVMYLSATRPIWQYETESTILDQRTTALLTEAEETWTLRVKYNKVVLGQIDLTSGA